MPNKLMAKGRRWPMGVKEIGMRRAVVTGDKFPYKNILHILHIDSGATDTQHTQIEVVTGKATQQQQQLLLTLLLLLLL